MNAKSSVFVICVEAIMEIHEAIIYFVLFNLNDCTFRDV